MAIEFFFCHFMAFPWLFTSIHCILNSLNYILMWKKELKQLKHVRYLLHKYTNYLFTRYMYIAFSCVNKKIYL